MSIRISYKQIISLIICIALLFTYTFQVNVFAKSNLENGEYEVLVNNSEQIKIRTEQEGIKATLTMDKETQEIKLQTNEKSEKTNKNEKNYKIEISDITPEGDIIAEYTDLETGEKFKQDSTKLKASFAFLVPLGVIIGTYLLEQLLALTLAITIAGISYAVVTEVANTLQNDPNYDHYMAKIMDGDVWIGNALSLTQAAERLIAFDPYNHDVWSVTWYKAELVAEVAGGGITPVGPEIEPFPGPGYYYHYHRYDRLGGHSFFGS